MTSIKIIDYAKFIFNKSVVSYKKETTYDEHFTIDNGGGGSHMLYNYNYNKFKSLIDAFRNPYYQLMEENGEDVSKI